ncbi:MAG: DUF3473 domain-containing protein [Saprospiraceae bacterium]|nr:DUF3473 domain-containing protein [Saprospiraceae bacterium]
MLHAFTIDLEEWFCSHNLQAAVKPSDRNRLPLRAAAPTCRLLEMLEKRGIKATFFVLGQLAEQLPDLVRDIQKAGHEIASHGYAHLLTTQHTPGTFAEDLIKAGSAIQDCTGIIPDLFRAPAFSITPATLWALDVLKQQGFRADSSVFPLSWHPDYGMPDAPLLPYKHDNGLLEFPMSVVEMGGKRWPVSGGAYFRMLPFGVYERLIRRLEKQGRPLLFYLHPWELDPGMPRLPGLSRMARFRHYAFLETVERKLNLLLQNFEFAPLGVVFNQPCNTPTGGVSPNLP